MVSGCNFFALFCYLRHIIYSLLFCEKKLENKLLFVHITKYILYIMLIGLEAMTHNR